MPETDQEREDKAAQVAYAQGRRDADVDSRLYNHEKRLNAINGSIERHATSVQQLDATVNKTREAFEAKIEALITAQATHAAIEADRAANKLNNRTFVIGVATVVVMLLSLIVAIVALILTHS